MPDSEGFINLGKNLNTQHWFCNNVGMAETFRTPGYPLFLSAIFTVFGNNYTAVLVIQIVITGLMILLIAKVFSEFNVPKRTGILGLALFFFELTTYIYSACILSDIILFDCLVISAFFLAKYVSVKKSRYLILLSVSLSYALLTRPIMTYYNLILCVVVVICAFLRKIKVRDCIVCVFILAGVFFGWSFRNYMQADSFVYSDVRNLNLMYFDAACLRAEIEGISKEDAISKFEAEFKETYPDDSEEMSLSQHYQKVGEFGSKYIWSHFGAYLWMNVKGLITEMIGPNNTWLNETIDNGMARTIVKWLYMGYLAVIYILYGLFILLHLIKKVKLRTIDWFVLTVSGYCAVASASLGYSRFRVAWFGLIIMGVVLLFNNP